jgi:hypothetical protein
MINPDWTNNIPSEDWAKPRKLKLYNMIVAMAEDIVNYNWTVRQAAKEYCVGKSSVCRWVEMYLKHLDYDLYNEVKNKFNFHRQYTSGWRRML